MMPTTDAEVRNDQRIGTAGAIALIVLAAIFGYTFYPAITRLAKIWYHSEHYSHGFLIIPISAYLLWQRRAALQRLPVRPTVWGPVMLVMSLLLYIFAVYGGIATLESLSPILFIYASVLFLFGKNHFRAMLFPLAFLLFMVPIPSQILTELTLFLQLFVTKVCVFFSKTMGLPVFRTGNVIELPAGKLQVVDACSGLRSLMSLLALSAVMGYLMLSRPLPRTLLFLSGIPIAVMVNIFRVMAIILCLHYFGYDLSQDSVHTVFGIVIFGLALLMLIFFKWVLNRYDSAA